MRSNTVITGDKSNPTAFRFARQFNVAVPFIDRHVVEGRGDRIAIRSVFEDVSYAALAQRVARCGNVLRQLGLSPRTRLLMVVKDCPEFFYLFWGAIKAGIVPVPLNTLLRADDYTFIIQDSRCAAVVYSSEFAEEVEAAVTASGHQPRHVLPVETGDKPSVVGLMGEARANLAATCARPEDKCFWLYSSGSTDRPKGLVHSHRNMVVTSQLYGVNVLGICSDDISFSAAKLFFAYGLGNVMTFPLWVGATAVLLPERSTPQSTFAMIERFRPTVYFGVPHLYAAQIQALETVQPDLSSLRLCVSAGEALPVPIFEKWRELTGTVILDGIGSTEALHIFITNRLDDLRPGTSGRVVPGYQARILDPKGRPARAGQPGQLHISGGSIAKSRSHHPGDKQKSAAHRWIKTGDVFVQDAGGYYVYCGRSDDMLKVSSTWCSPLEIEAVLAEHPGVVEAAVVGRADADGLIRPEAWIVINEERADPDRIERELVQHCKAKLAPHKYPRWFHFISELPKTATGKIQRFKLRAMAGGETSGKGLSKTGVGLNRESISLSRSRSRPASRWDR